MGLFHRFLQSICKVNFKSSQMSAKTTPQDPELTPHSAYNLNMFTSNCCHAFNIYDGTSCICSQCGRVITQITDDELLTISVKFNDAVSSNVSGDIVETFRERARRFATDPTYEICSQKCPKCKSLCRYARDAQKDIIFICSNPKCRNVFTPTNEKILDPNIGSSKVSDKSKK